MKGGALMANRHFRALSAAALAGAAVCLSWWLCGERKVASSLILLKRLVDDPKESTVVRKSAFRALWALDGL